MAVLSTYREIIDTLGDLTGLKIFYAYPNDHEALETVKMTVNSKKFGRWVLLGDRKKIQDLAEATKTDISGCEIFDMNDPAAAAKEAVRLVASEKRGILVKGDLNSSDFMRAVLNKDTGIRRSGLLSHLSIFEIPGFDRLIFMTDGGINIAPTTEEKVMIIRNSVDYLKQIGYESPRTAILAANEVVTEKMPVTVEAAGLVRMAREGAADLGEIDGPMALDVALDPEAARHKNADGPVAGRADLLIVPDIEAGNILGKSLIYCARAVMAGIVLGAAAPIILTSRMSPPETKLASLAMAALCCDERS